jgi:intracellular sulfur oxidation DsrE/DsrF family protein
MPLRRSLLAAIAALALILPFTAAAGSDNARALKGLEQGKVVWNITLENPQQLAGQMRVIQQTYQDLKGAGIDPKMVLGFHSTNVNYLAKDLDHIALEKMDAVQRFQEALGKVADLEGVRVEACAIANRFFGMQGKAVRDDVEVVANGYVSFIAYQHKGYGMIGIH